MFKQPTINIVLPIGQKEFLGFIPKDYEKNPKTFVNYLTERLVELGKLQLELCDEDDLVNFLSGKNGTCIVNLWSDDNQKLFTVTALLREPTRDIEALEKNKKPVIEFVKCPGKRGKAGRGLLSKLCRRIFP